LARYFAPLDGRHAHPALATPKTLYACKASPDSPSLRPQHTLLPLAELLESQGGVAFNRDYFEGEEQALVEKALASEGPALISWKHNNLPLIANLILGEAATAPQAWPYGRVDMVWVFDRHGAGWRFTQIPQLLLAGDSAEIIG
jgi:hypothetical protein